jgi:hypothetical protein
VAWGPRERVGSERGAGGATAGGGEATKGEDADMPSASHLNGPVCQRSF